MRARLVQLETAHRALAAQHTALIELIRALLPLLPVSSLVLERAVEETVRRCSAGTENMDPAFQAAVQKWVSILAADALEPHCAQGQVNPASLHGLRPAEEVTRPQPYRSHAVEDTAMHTDPRSLQASC